MKNRDLILDFTSLLDVTLIVIFFFVLFSQLDSIENKARTDKIVEEYNNKIEIAENRESLANEIIVQKEKELAIVKSENKRRASEVEELITYSNGENMKIILDMIDDTWNVRIIQNKETISLIEKRNDIGTEIVQAMEKSGYSTDHAIFCDFVFDGSIPGTRRAHAIIVDGLDDVKKKYDEFYYSETDLSVGKGKIDEE